MIAFAQWAKYAHGYDQGSQTNRLELWHRISEAKGELISEIADAPKLPSEATYIWNDYLSLSNGTDRVTYKDLAAYKEITGAEISPWEASVILKIDQVVRAA